MERLGPSGQAWSVGRWLYGLGDVHDVDGRPLGERRASSEAKRGCPMELAPCPYDDERHGIAMNVTALEQVKGHLGVVHADVSAFHASLPADLDPVARMFMAVLDQLISPAVFLVQHEHDALAVPAMQATGHKLAAGLFAVMLSLDTERARGLVFEATIDSIMERIHTTRALIGAGGVEACAGPLKLVRRTTAVFLGDHRESPTRVDAARVTIARGLYQQVRIGIVLRLVDEYLERHLLAAIAGRVTARNHFIRAKLDERLEEFAASAAPPAPDVLVPFLPQDLAPMQRYAIANALGALVRAERNAPPLADTLAEFVRERRGALTLDAHGDPRQLGILALAAIEARQACTSVLVAIEHALREAIGRTAEAPLRLSSLVLPASRCLPWFTALTALQVSVPVDSRPECVLRDPTGSGRTQIPFTMIGGRGGPA